MFAGRGQFIWQRWPTGWLYVRYRSLADFHALAVEQFGVEDVDWNEIAGDVPGIKVRVDANLIFPHEVDHTLSLIESAQDVPDDLRLRAMLAVSLMTDLGLRFGEVFRLRHKHLSIGRRFLYIRNTRDGEVKTHNGTRILPFGVLATARTKALMDRVMALTDPEGKLAGEAALFGALGNLQELMPRSVLTRLANQALRTATGDPTTRLHHLRHGVATRLFDQVVLPADRDANAPLLQEIVGTTDPTRRAMHSLAMLLGHGSGQTTAISYLHQQERRVALAMNRLPTRNSDRFIATLIKQSEAAIRTYRSRDKNQGDILLAYARKVFARIPSLDVAHGADVTTPPTILKADWIAGVLEGSLAQVDRTLRLQFRSGLAPSAAAMLSGVTESFASTLATTAKDIARELLLPSDEHGIPEAFLSPRSLCGNNMVMAHAIANIERTDDSIQLASLSLRSYDYGQYAWVCRDGYALKAILSWISLAGIEPSDISIRVPAHRWDEVDGYVSQVIYAAAQLLPVDSRAQRTRGVDPFEVTINATGAGSMGSRFVHATYLQLIRWRATP